MKFSVLMSIYFKENPDDFDECMKSIWDNQSLKPSEIVLVEDGPLTTELYSVIKSWKNKLSDILRIIKLPENVGTGKAKNHGLDACSFEIICIVDTDDIYASDRFQKQVQFLKMNPDITIVGGQIVEFVENIDSPSGMRKVPLNHNELVNYAKKKNPLNNVTIAYRKTAIQAVGGYKHHLWMEDYNLFLRVIAAGHKIHNLPDVLVYARVDNGMHGRRKGMKYIQSEFQLMKLKINLKTQGYVSAYFYFLLRSSTRLLPTSILSFIYDNFLRKKP